MAFEIIKMLEVKYLPQRNPAIAQKGMTKSKKVISN
jgi:hypothetical protein